MRDAGDAAPALVPPADDMAEDTPFARRWRGFMTAR
jgi:hypothetical protein